jgi:hypothetical protein
LALPAYKDLRAHKARQVFKVCKGIKASLALEQRDYKEHKAHKVKLA